MNKGRYLATADWHGCGKVGFEVLDSLGPNDKLFYLGDCIDRGSNGVELFDALWEDPRVIMLRGNHEDMMRRAIPDLLEGRETDDVELWLYYNGGIKTWNKLCSKSEQEIKKYCQRIDMMSNELSYISPKGHFVIMEHAGHTPFAPDLRKHDPLWDRTHFGDKWVQSDEAKHCYLVHGHTPVQYLKFMYGYVDQPTLTEQDLKDKLAWCTGGEISSKPEVIRYCDNHKFDIDMCTIASNRIAVLNLDTFETEYFDAED